MYKRQRPVYSKWLIPKEPPLVCEVYCVQFLLSNFKFFNKCIMRSRQTQAIPVQNQPFHTVFRWWMHWRRRCRQVLQKEFHETQPSSQQQIHLNQVLIPTHRRGNYSASLRWSTLLLNHEHRVVHFHGWCMQEHEYCQSWKIPEGIARWCNGASRDMTRRSWPFLAGTHFALTGNCIRKYRLKQWSKE